MFATLLDFDGVLVDTEPVHLAAFNDVLAPLGLSIEQPDYTAHYLSLDDAGVFRAILSKEGREVREEDIRALVTAKGPPVMARFNDGFRVFPGASDLIARRAARGPVGIVSGALASEIAFGLHRMGDRAVAGIAFVVSAESTAASKPDPAPFLAGLRELRRLGFEGRTVVVEDSTGGITAAKRAGLRCVAVSHTYAPHELLRAGADAVVSDLPSLTDALLEDGI